MPSSLLPFPAFDPVLVTIGPFAIRWYALAYIAGILLGWLYARALIRNRSALGRAGADDGRRLRRFRPVGDARHHPRRPRRLRAVLQSRRISSPTRSRSCSSGRAACRSTAASSAACSRSRCSPGSAASRSCRSATSTCAVGTDRAVSRPARQFHQRRAVGPADRRALGDGVSGRRTAAAPPEPALRGHPRRAGAAPLAAGF